VEVQHQLLRAGPGRNRLFSIAAAASVTSDSTSKAGTLS